jgi:hypothetical protein
VKGICICKAEEETPQNRLINLLKKEERGNGRELRILKGNFDKYRG